MARAIAPGLLVGAMIYAQGDRSGAHFNPAVSLAFTLRGLFPVRLLPWYVGAQLVGATVAGALVWALLGPAAIAAGVTAPHGIDAATAVGVEIVLTWLLVTVILGVADRYRVVGTDAALAVAAAISLCGLVALPLEGASMNPARSTGPAIVAADLGSLWVYWVGPLAGAVAAVATTTLVHGRARRDEKQREAANGG